MKKIFTIFLLLGVIIGNAQTYNPSQATISNKPYGSAQAFPTDSRSMFYDQTNFIWRPYQNISEVKSYLNLPKYRVGNFLIVVDSGGILQPNGSYIGGVNNFWMFKDSTADANLVELNLQGSSSGTCSTCLLKANNLSDLTNANTARANLGLGSMAVLNTTAGGDLSGTFPNPTVARLNGQLPSFYLNYLNLVNTPVIPAQLNPTAAGLLTITGTYPNLTFNARTPGLQEVITSNNALSADNTINSGAFNLLLSGTASLGLPSGTTAQRPSSPVAGMFRFNTDSLKTETYNGSAWITTGSGGGGGGSGITALTGDVTASGTGSVPATLATVNSNVFGSNTFLKFAVNGKGLTTSATAVGSGDIISALGYTPYNATNPSGYITLTSLSGTSPIGYNNATGAISCSTCLVGNQSITWTGSGDVSGTASGTTSITPTLTIGNNKVTYAKFQASSQAALLGATTAGNYGEITLGTGLAFSGSVLNATGGSFTNPMTTNGDMIYQVGGTYGRLAVAAHAGMKLTSGSSGAISWVDTTAGGGGSQNLQTTLGIGNTSTLQMKLTNDTAFFFASNPKMELVGDSVLSSLDSIATMGDSWTFGTGPSVVTNGYAYLYPPLYGSTVWNRGVNGRTLVSSGGGNSLMENIAQIPIYEGNYKLLSIMIGVNDAALGTSASLFNTTYQAYLDSCIIEKGWPVAKIAVFSPGYNNGIGHANITSIVTACQTAAAAMGVQYVDVFDYMKNYPGGESQLMNADSLHPNDLGSRVVVQAIAHGLVGISFAGNLAVDGILVVNKNDTLKGMSNFLGPELHDSTINNLGGNGGTGTGIGKPNLRIQFGRNLNTFYTYPINFTANTLDAGQTFQDSFQIAMFSNGGHPEIHFLKNTTAFLKFLNGGGAAFDGAAQAGWGYSFNNTNGVYVVDGALIKNGAGKGLALGDGTAAFQEFWFNTSAGGLGWMAWKLAGTVQNSIRMSATGTYAGGSGVSSGRQMVVYDEVKGVNVGNLQDSSGALTWGPSRSNYSAHIQQPAAGITGLEVRPTGKAYYNYNPPYTWSTSGADSTWLPDLHAIDSFVRAQVTAGAPVTSVSNSNGTLTVSPTTGAVVASLALGHANTWTAVQTQPAPILTGLTSAGANDSVLTVDPSTGQVHRKSGTFNLFAANGLTAAGGDSIYWGGTLNQATTLALGGFPLKITGIPLAAQGTATTALVRNATDSSLAQLVVTSGTFTPTLTNTTNITTSAVQQAYYSRVGNIVHVVISILLTPSASLTNSTLTFSLPFNTSITTQSNVGEGSIAPNAGGVLYVSGLTNITGTNTGTFVFYYIGTTTTSNCSISFDYSL